MIEMEDNYQKGLSLFKNKQFDEALNEFLKEIKNIDDGNSCAEKATILDYIGQSYRHLKKFDMAIKFLEESLSLTADSNQATICLLLRNLGSCYSASGNHIESLKCLERSLKLAREIKDNDSEAELLYEIGTQYLDSGKLDKALDPLKKSLIIYERLGLKNKIDKVRREIREVEEDIKEQNWMKSKVSKHKKYDYDIL